MFGPEQQDKDTNQDFALSAELMAADGTIYSLAIVADGVSTGTLWPERSARLICFAAYKFVHHWLSVTPTPFEEKVVQRDGLFRTGLVDAMRDALLADRDLLNGLNFVSPAWAPAIYGRLMDDDRLWYNTTLLMACMGGTRGIYVSVGDGGAVLFRDRGQGSEEITLLRSDASLTIPHAVNLTMSPNDFVMRPINLEGVKSATMVLASDGVDRTLQRLDGQLDYGVLARTPPAPRTAIGFLDRILASEADLVEPDNMSVAMARMPTARRGAIRSPRELPIEDITPPSEYSKALLLLLPRSENVSDWEVAQAQRPNRVAPPLQPQDESGAQAGTGGVHSEPMPPPQEDVHAGASRDDSEMVSPSISEASPKQPHSPPPAKSPPPLGEPVHKPAPVKTSPPIARAQPPAPPAVSPPSRPEALPLSVEVLKPEAAADEAGGAPDLSTDADLSVTDIRRTVALCAKATKFLEDLSQTIPCDYPKTAETSIVIQLVKLHLSFATDRLNEAASYIYGSSKRDNAVAEAGLRLQDCEKALIDLSLRTIRLYGGDYLKFTDGAGDALLSAIVTLKSIVNFDRVYPRV